jgi:fumarylacetoacetase
MIFSVNETHDSTLQSWVESANDPANDFPVQNLPFGRFRRPGEGGWQVCVAIGDQVLDLRRAGLIGDEDMNQLMALGLEDRNALRFAISRGLCRGSAQKADWQRKALVPQSCIELGVPCEIGDYTDFYTSVQHATAVGRMFRPDSPLLSNYHWLPIGYHGRSSSIRASGHCFPRPVGQFKPPEAEVPVVGPSRRLDYELELGVFVGRPNALGEPIAIAEAEAHLFGLALFNDWSARDLQAWEYQPLGPAQWHLGS